MPKLAQTTFGTTPEDSVAVVDVYTTTTATPQNNLIKSTTALAVDISSPVIEQIQKAANPELFTQIALGAITGDTTSRDDALAAIRSATGGALSRINDPSMQAGLLTDLLHSVGFSDTSSDLVKGLLKLPGSTSPTNQFLDSNPKLKLIYNNVEHIRNTADIKTAQGTFALMSSIANDDALATVLDTKSQFAVYGSLIAKAQELGVPGIVDTVTSKLSPADRRSFYLQQLPTLLGRSDITALAAALDHVSPEQVMYRNPGSIAQILAGYTLPPDAPKPTLSLCNALTDLLARIDPHWYQVLRHGTWITDLTNFTQASKDALALLVLSDTFFIPARLATRYPSVDLISYGRQCYPSLAL